MSILSIFAKEPSACDTNKILIVDDEAPIRKLFNMILSIGIVGAEIDEACNGLEAVRLFQDKRHGIILMDLRMPVMGGFQAYLTIKNVCSEAKLLMPAFIFCTGFASPAAVQEIVGEGKSCRLLMKPTKSADLIQAVKACRKE